MLAEMFLSGLCLYFLDDHGWVVMTVISINLFITALLLVAGAKRNEVLVIDVDKYNERMDGMKKEMLAWKQSQLDSELALNASYMPLFILAALSRTSLRDMEVWIDNGLLPYVGSRECPFIKDRLVVKLFKDEEGKFHLIDDYHKPLTAADIKAAVGSLGDGKPEDSHA